MLGSNNMAITTDPGFVNYSNGDYELKEGLELFNQMPEFKSHSMEEFGPQDVSAEVQIDNLKDYIFNLDIVFVSKALLVKNLDSVMDSLEADQYKQALVKLKVFMAEAKILEPMILSSEQFDYIIDESLVIFTKVWEDEKSQNADSKDTKADQILAFLKNFMKTKDKSDKDNDLMDEIDNLINTIQQGV